MSAEDTETQDDIYKRRLADRLENVFRELAASEQFNVNTVFNPDIDYRILQLFVEYNLWAVGSSLQWRQVADDINAYFFAKFTPRMIRHRTMNYLLQFPLDDRLNNLRANDVEVIRFAERIMDLLIRPAAMLFEIYRQAQFFDAEVEGHYATFSHTGGPGFKRTLLHRLQIYQQRHARGAIALSVQMDAQAQAQAQAQALMRTTSQQKVKVEGAQTLGQLTMGLSATSTGTSASSDLVSGADMSDGMNDSSNVGEDPEDAHLGANPKLMSSQVRELLNLSLSMETPMPVLLNIAALWNVPIPTVDDVLSEFARMREKDAQDEAAPAASISSSSRETPVISFSSREAERLQALEVTDDDNLKNLPERRLAPNLRLPHELVHDLDSMKELFKDLGQTPDDSELRQYYTSVLNSDFMGAPVYQAAATRENDILRRKNEHKQKIEAQVRRNEQQERDVAQRLLSLTPSGRRQASSVNSQSEPPTHCTIM